MFENTPIIAAMITPFTKADTIDYAAIDRLVDRLLGEGVTGFLVAGTTGESPNLTHAEKIALFEYYGQKLGDQALVIANVGTNGTAASVAMAREASVIAGVDALLAVTPYYNKPSQAGMIAHFTAIADASRVPVMLYNIPGRSVVRLTNATVLTLAQHPNITAIKQCTGTADIATLVAQTPADFAVFTGEDAEMLPARRVGAAGVISVAAHIYAPQMQECLEAEAAGDHITADDLSAWLVPRMNALFAYPSPEPAKMYLARTGEVENTLRLPLLPLTTAEAEHVRAILEEN